MACSIGSPAMLFDASMRRIAPLDFERAVDPEAVDGAAVLGHVEAGELSSR